MSDTHNLKKEGLFWLMVSAVQSTFSGLQDGNTEGEGYGGGKLLSSFMAARSREKMAKLELKLHPQRHRPSELSVSL